MNALNSTIDADELTDEQRKAVQLKQSEEFTMGGHVRKVLAIKRKQLAETLGQSEPGAAADDDMQILARDLYFGDKRQETTQAVAAPAPNTGPPASRWPWAIALAAGLGIPSTTGILMAPWIIEAFKDKPTVVAPQPTKPIQEYIPILKPGKPAGVT